MPTPEELQSRPGVELVRILVHTGEVMPDMRTSTAHSAGFALLVADGEAELEERMDDLNAYLSAQARVA
jgi:hypothetical protein